MTPIDQMKALAESARARQRAFGADAQALIAKAAAAGKEADAFEEAAKVLERDAS
jgi:hypothetical protein